VKLEIVDTRRNLHRTFSSEAKEQKRPPLPIADRWFPKDQRLEKSPGMHRFVWNLAWGADLSGDEESEYGSPRGPRAVPGNYEVRLTVDGKTWTQPLSVVMDPRSPATAQELEQQLKLGAQIYAEALQSRRILAEIRAVQKQLSDLQPKLAERSDLTKTDQAVTAKVKAILSGDTKDAKDTNTMGVETASAGLGAALRVVESGDRTVPAQALDVYKLASSAMSSRIQEWKALKAAELAQLNEELKKADLTPVSANEGQQE
jgi:hypothetical protein